jgi:hypothetical protein
MMQSNTCLNHELAISGLQRDSVEIKKTFIDFIPFDVKTAEIIRAEIQINCDKMDSMLKAASVNLMTIKQQSLVFTLVFKNEI